MAAPRKVFRIEETPAARFAADSAEAAQRHTEIMRALDALSSAFAAPAAAVSHSRLSSPAPGRLASELNLIADRLAGAETGNGEGSDPAIAPFTRIANELFAVTSGTEQATQKILAAAEEIDQFASNLTAALNGKIEQGLAQDIQDLVVRIFEACNFQDLIGQRVNKVMTTLKFVEEHITSVLEEIKSMSTRPSGDGAQYLHGPRLDHDNGHVSQLDIDAIFDT